MARAIFLHLFIEYEDAAKEVSPIIKEVRQFQDKIADDQLKEDLEKYERMALDLGATDAKIITKASVIIDEKVRARCSSPRCPDYGTNLNCPPYAWDLDQTRRVVSQYEHGILVMLRVPPQEHAGKDYYDFSHHRVPGALKMYEIVAKVQSAAFYDGYHLAIGFSGGPSCKRVFCPSMECSGTKGTGCRLALKVNPTLHGVGMDAYTMATRAGWNLYPIGKSVDPSQVPYATEVGLVLVF